VAPGPPWTQMRGVCLEFFKSPQTRYDVSPLAPFSYSKGALPVIVGFGYARTCPGGRGEILGPSLELLLVDIVVAPAGPLGIALYACAVNKGRRNEAMREVKGVTEWVGRSVSRSICYCLPSVNLHEYSHQLCRLWQETKIGRESISSRETEALMQEPVEEAPKEAGGRFAKTTGLTLLEGQTRRIHIHA
jgi:hypothetical protein